jgi:Protein of unknown function (DUF3276)
VEFGQFKKREGGSGGFRENQNRDNRDFKSRDNRSGGFKPRERDTDERDRDESVFSKRVRAGKRRTYFFDVKKTKGEDFFITITESTRREDGFGYKRHKLFLYKEDFNRFVTSLNETVDHVKQDLMPNFDYEEFDRRQAEWEAQNKDSEQDQDLDTGSDEPVARVVEPKKDEDDMSW